VVVDPKGADFNRYEGAQIIKPNLKELAEASRLPLDSEASVETAARKIISESRAASLVVTRGPAGILLVPANGVARNFPSETREVFDVSGAGDTVAATLAAGVAAGLPIESIVQLANIAGGVVVSRVGTAVVHRQELAQALHQRAFANGDKVLGVAEAAERLKLWRRAGFRIGFTNGRFNTLHPGNVSLLQKARAHCDRLVVGLRGDSSMTTSRESGGPIQDEIARSLVLSSLMFVDLIVIFHEPTPESLIRELRPEILIKRSGHPSEEVLNADLVRNWGGEVVLEGQHQASGQSRLFPPEAKN